MKVLLAANADIEAKTKVSRILCVYMCPNLCWCLFVCLFVLSFLIKDFFIFYIFLFYLFKKKRDTLKFFIFCFFVSFLLDDG